MLPTWDPHPCSHQLSPIGQTDKRTGPTRQAEVRGRMTGGRRRLLHQLQIPRREGRKQPHFRRPGLLQACRRCPGCPGSGRDATGLASGQGAGAGVKSHKGGQA